MLCRGTDFDGRGFDTRAGVFRVPRASALLALGPAAVAGPFLPRKAGWQERRSVRHHMHHRRSLSFVSAVEVTSCAGGASPREAKERGPRPAGTGAWNRAMIMTLAKKELIHSRGCHAQAIAPTAQ